VITPPTETRPSQQSQDLPSVLRLVSRRTQSPGPKSRAFRGAPGEGEFFRVCEKAMRPQRVPVQARVASAIAAAVLLLLSVSSATCAPLGQHRRVAAVHGFPALPHPSSQPLTPLSQLHSLTFQRTHALRTATCTGGSARHHHAFYPIRLYCAKLNHALTLDDAEWSCRPSGPRTALTVVSATVVRCHVKQRMSDLGVFDGGGDTIDLVDTSTCELRYRLDFRSESLAAIALIAAVAVFSGFAAAANVLLAPLSAAYASGVGMGDGVGSDATAFASFGRAWRGSGWRAGTGKDGEYGATGMLSRARSSSALLGYATSNSALLASKGRAIAAREEARHDRLHAALEVDGTWMMGGRAVSPDDEEAMRAVAGYGTYARVVERNFSDTSLHFSSGPPSPAGTPPSSVNAWSDPRVGRPRKADVCQAEMLTELF
jgi:hypothetical protein